MSNIYFTGDLHFGHRNIIKYCDRPFADVPEMDQALIQGINRRVKFGDTLWILGDVFFCSPGHAHAIMDRFECQDIRLVLGNHDERLSKLDELRNRFSEIHTDRATKNINGTMVVMDHYPMQSWLKSGRGSYMLHGHVHSKVPTDGKYRRYDVGVDANGYEPVSWKEIKKTLDKIDPADGSAAREARAM